METCDRYDTGLVLRSVSILSLMFPSPDILGKLVFHENFKWDFLYLIFTDLIRCKLEILSKSSGYAIARKHPYRTDVRHSNRPKIVANTSTLTASPNLSASNSIHI